MLGGVHANDRRRAIAARSASRSRSKGGTVMAGATDMSNPVTRGELRAELAPLATKAELVPLATKAELQAAIAPLATKAELQAAIAPLATKIELEYWCGALLVRLERMEGLEQRLAAELARHTRASFESMSTQISVIEEKYADLPPRVSRLEGKVLPRERR
jgi:hypothetical protein